MKLTIVFRPLLIPGMIAKMPDGNTLMLIDSDDDEREQNVTMFHETVHLLLEAGGIPLPHDEEMVEAFAIQLASACEGLLRVIKEAQPKGMDQ